MDQVFDELSRTAARAKSRREALLVMIAALFGMGQSCFPTTPSSNSGGGSGSGGSSCPCSSGYTYNFSSRKCCDSTYPYYYPGTHGIYQVGCYQSCPYVGDCGSRFQSC